MALNNQFPVGAQQFDILQADNQPNWPQSINVFGRSDSLAEYGATNFVASDIIATSVEDNSYDNFAIIASFGTQNPLLPGETSAVLGVSSSIWNNYHDDAIGATLTVPLGDGYGGHGYVLQGNLLVGAEAPEPSSAMICLAGLSLSALLYKRRPKRSSNPTGA